VTGAENMNGDYKMGTDNNDNANISLPGHQHKTLYSAHVTELVIQHPYGYPATENLALSTLLQR
jgi:hypothetical protein